MEGVIDYALYDEVQMKKAPTLTIWNLLDFAVQGWAFFIWTSS